MNNIKKNSYKILNKVSLYIKKLYIYISKKFSSLRKTIGTIYGRYILKHIKQIAIGFLSLVLAVGLGYGIYKYFTTPRAPDIKAAGGGYLYKAKGMDFTAFIGSKANNRPDINFAVGSGSVVFTPASGNENSAKPEMDGKKAIVFKDVYENIDFRYKTIPLGIKEDIIIRKPTPIRTFPFFLDFKDVTPQYITENIKGTAFFDKDGNYLFNFEKPYAVDANGARTDNLGLLIQKDPATGRYVAVVTLDDSWMNDPKRTYPITVDPTIIHDTTSEFATGGLNRVVDNGANVVPVLTTNHQEVPADIHTVGLWHMNETSGNALDSSGNGYTGTPTGTTIVSGQNGYGKARSFNGSGDSIALGDIMNGIPLPVTIEAWTYQSELCTGTCTIFHSDDPDTDAGNYYGFSLATGSGNNLGAAFYNGVSAGPDGRRSFSSANGVLPTGRWNHVAAVISGTYDVAFYVNGQFIPTTSISGTGTTMVHNSNPARIGRNTRYGLTYFGGIIDEVRISDIARTPEEIASNALNGQYSTYTSPVIDMTTVQSWSPLTWTGSGFTTGSGETATASATSNLVAQWNFNETSGTTAAVATGSCGATCNGTLTNFASTGSQDAAAKTGWTANNRRWGAGALMFDGTNDHVTTGYQWNSSQPFTIEAWVNPASETAGDWQKVIASNRGTGTPPYFDFYMGTGTTYTDFGFAVWNDAYTTSWIVASGGQNDNGIKDKSGKWHHVVAVYYPNDKIQIYVDGEFKKETTGLSGFSATGSAMTFGIHSPAYGPNTRWFDGALDTSRVYNKALTASEILSNYNLGQVELQTRVGNTSNSNDGTWEEWRPVTSETAIESLNGPYQYNTTDTGLTHYWPMDEVSGTSVADVKGANGGTATGTLVNNGKFGKARGLNGTSDYVSIGNVAATQGTAYTVEFWAKKDTATSIPAVYSENTPASWSNNLFIIYYGDSSGTYNGGIRVWYRDGAGTGGTVITYPTNVADGKWHHVVLVQSATNSRTLYLDGIVIGTDTVAKNALSVTNAYIGAANNNGTMQQFFNGSLDEMRTYNSALSASTIQQHFIEGSANANTIAPSTNTTIKIDGSGSEEIHLGQTPVDAYTAGLWHLDETTGTSAYIKDSSGNGNHGTPTGTTLVEGYSSKARNFDGSSGYIEVTSSTSLQFTSTFTLEAWIKRNTDATGTERLLSKSDTSGYDYWLQILDDSTLQCGNTKADASSTYRATTATIPVGKWTLVTCTFDAALGFNLYINGVLSNGTQVGTLGATRTSTRNFQIARLGSTSWYYTFNGIMDEVRVSSVARPADQIAETYRAGNGYTIGKTITSTDLSSTPKLPFYVASDRLGTYSQLTLGESPYANYEPNTNTVGLWHLDEDAVPNQSGLVSWWRMDETSGTSLTDTSGAGNTSTTTGTTAIAGRFGNARSFNGSSDYSTSANSLSFTSEPFTISMWVNPTNLSNSPVIISSGAYQVDGYYCHILSTGGVSCLTNQSGASQSTDGSASFTTGSWQLLTIARNGSSIRIYRNGIDITSTAGTHTNPTSTTRKFVIGRYDPSAGYYYNGSTDDVRVYNRTLSAAEILAMYGSIKDSSGIGTHGSVFGTPATRQGKLGKALSFNGSTDLIDLNTTLSTLTNNFSISLWVMPNSTQNTYADIFGNHGFNGINGVVLEQNGGSTNSYYFGYGNGSAWVTMNSVQLLPNTWQHLTMTKDSNTCYLYLNGTLATTLACTSAVSPSSVNLRLGSSYISGRNFGGSIDEFRIDNVVRTADEIRQAYEVGFRTHDITIDFKAILLEESIFGDTITGSTDLFFLVDETVYGSSARANHIFPGDKIIVKDNMDGTEYIAQGTVAAADPVNGFITVTSWDSGSTFPPSGGYTNKAIAFKWQREYFDLTGSMSTHRNAVTRLTYRITNGSAGANIWLDDLRSSTGYLVNALGSTITSSTGRRYAQYRAIIAQHTPANISPTLTTVAMNYTGNSAPNTPSQDTPSNGSIMYSTTPLRTTATDPNSNTIRYKIILCTTSEMTTGCQTFDQNVSQTGWSEQNADGGTSYTSGSQGAYTVQSALSPGVTYYWKSYAIDPSGSNTWSSTQATPYSFTKVGYPTEPTNLLTMGLVNPNDVKTITPYFSAIYNSSFNVSASHYQLQVSSSPDFSGALMWDSGQVVATGIAPGQTHPNITYAGSALSWNGTYYWRIKFWNVYGNAGPYSQAASFSLDSVSTSCRIQETSGDTSLTVVWTDNATAETGYEVQRSVDGAGFAVLHTGLAANTQSDIDNTISTGHTYQYKVAPYYTGAVYDNWCTTETLTLQLGEFSIKGFDLKGLDLR
jgi:hypothetical protein